MPKRVRKYFLTGIATVLPLIVTFWFLTWLFEIVDSLLLDPFLNYVQNYFSYPGIDIIVKVVLVLVLVLLLSFLGFLVSFLFFRRFLNFFENLFLKFPIVGKIYKSIKQISDAVMGEGRNVFKKVVFVEYPSDGRFCIGFMTAKAEKILNEAVGSELIAIFIPTTPNPTSGMLIYYPKEKIKYLDMTVEEGMRVVISAGTAIVSSDD
ncbi:MAG: DUF502 domain-containing protein [Candidatus Kaelpia aquatica]|nr:DUF502 domain-containing protein [Candidatus Kaelpia aquatica]